jgi:hypothetical protein
MAPGQFTHLGPSVRNPWTRLGRSTVAHTFHSRLQRPFRPKETLSGRGVGLMSCFEVRCAVGEYQISIEVPTDCSVGDVLKKASEQSGVRGVSLWSSGMSLNRDHLFADYFEPEAIYHVRNYPEGSLLSSCEVKLAAIGVAPSDPQLLMDVHSMTWSMDEFREKAGDFAPTMVLIEMENGTVCGGVAGVPWPTGSKWATDPAKGSFIFSLGAAPARFDLLTADAPLYCGDIGFQFGRADLYVLGDGDGCGSSDNRDYVGSRGSGQLIGGTAESARQRYVRWELWRL